MIRVSEVVLVSEVKYQRVSGSSEQWWWVSEVKYLTVMSSGGESWVSEW